MKSNILHKSQIYVNERKKMTLTSNFPSFLLHATLEQIVAEKFVPVSVKLNNFVVTRCPTTLVKYTPLKVIKLILGSRIEYVASTKHHLHTTSWR